MPIIQIIVVLAVIGFILWLVTTYIPMSPPIKTVITVLVIVLVVLWLLNIFVPGLGSFRVGSLR
jgi:hypothetical protein